MRTRFDGLSEFLSRRGRMKLLQILRDDNQSYEQIAQCLDVNRSTVYRWFHDPQKHPSNKTTEKIIDLAKLSSPKALKAVLIEEITKFINLANKRLVTKESVVLHGVTTKGELN
ncbi:hypothetical protein AKJ42_02660 [candidate division MSBL1 archaeon SCGC-AAA261C02]|uniref:Uncharacterized protein n=1 Tax=candidate division MSBL1 archaeon SCGC-AAA261C02 TaxID=1698272 RepID=A0A133UZW2_9EURY|nr:hypothetical protein AKJ42_02660 [candidate division MSBL1 archaeon SCGC-AAA261C02]